MATYTSAMRMTGLSGIDTESMVTAMMKAEGMKLDRLKATNQITQWTQSAYHNVTNVMKGFQTSFLNLTSSTSARLNSSFLRNAVSIKSSSTGKESSGIAITSSSGANQGSYSVKVMQLAQSDSYVGTSSSNIGKITGSVDFSIQSNIESLAEGDSFTVNLDGLSKTISLNASDIANLKANPAQDNSSTLAGIIQDKIDQAFGSEISSDPSSPHKVTVGVDGGKLTFTAKKGHTATIGGNADTLGKMGVSSGSSTSFNLKQTLAEAFNISGEVSFSINGVKFSFDSDVKVQDMMETINKKNAGVKFSYDSSGQQFKLESTSTGLANSIKISDDSSNFLQGAIGFSNDENLQGAKKAKDSIFEFNGVTTTRDSNKVSISGLTLELKEVTTAEEGSLNINVSKDTTNTLEFIKKFIENYNSMIDGINKELNTNRPKKDSYNYYQPLTDEEKEAMKDTDIVNWEAKAKTGLLYNDQLLRDVTSNLRTYLYQPVKMADGKEINLFNLGITFSKTFSDQGKLEIDEEKLKAAIDEYGEDIANVFTKTSSISSGSGSINSARLKEEGFSERINDIINSAVGSSGSITIKAGTPGDHLSDMSSSMYKTLTDQNKRISDMLAYLQQKETDYYTMFSKMEQAITAANSQMAYLQAQLG
ncbi:MAG: flagellar filament capping protein FliD [Clostridiales bacterium]|jgi:flagellar hook-associated protein 2|nr:flagellar filament capping protein FliD [Clostridiales bacterium]